MSSPLGKTIAPIFVVGTPRSGTTLAAKILGNHSHIFMPGETPFFDDIYARRKELADPQEPEVMERIVGRLLTLYGRYNESADQRRVDELFSPTVVDTLRASCKSYRDILSFFMNVQMIHERKVRWGNQVPKDLFNITEILSFYPDAKVLICIRDVRDFLLSYQNQWRTTAAEHAHRLKRLSHPLVPLLVWKSSMKQVAHVQELIPNENLMIIQYEDLVKNPQQVVRDICRVIDEEFEDAMLSIDTNNSSFQVQSRGIFASSIGRWREKLGNEEAYLAQRVNRKELQNLGYTLEPVRVNPWRLARILMTFPYALWGALNANKAVRGPLIPYLIRRAASFLACKGHRRGGVRRPPHATCASTGSKT